MGTPGLDRERKWKRKRISRVDWDLAVKAQLGSVMKSYTTLSDQEESILNRYADYDRLERISSRDGLHVIEECF